MKRPISVLTDQLKNDTHLLINPLIVSFSSSIALRLNVKQPDQTVAITAGPISVLVVSPINVGSVGMMSSVNGITNNFAAEEGRTTPLHGQAV